MTNRSGADPGWLLCGQLRLKDGVGHSLLDLTIIDRTRLGLGRRRSEMTDQLLVL